MPDIALYYPHIWMRDETWLKAALLYWPRIARMTPGWSGGEEQARNSVPPGPWKGCWPPETFARLRERDPGFLYDIDISSTSDRPAEAGPAEELTRVVETFGYELRKAYGIRSLLDEYPLHGRLTAAESAQDLPLEWVHMDKMTWPLAESLTQGELAVYGWDKNWLGMHPDLAWVYMCAITDEVARRTQMPAVTDEPHVHAALNGWTARTYANALLGGAWFIPATRDREEIGRRFTIQAFQIILPSGLEGIPVDRILDARENLTPRMYAYRRYLDDFSEQFTALAAVEDPRALDEHLDIMVRGELEPRLNELESQMKGLGLQPVRAVLAMKSLVPSALIAAATHEIGLSPTASASGAVAACCIGAFLDARQQAATAVAESPVSYLLELKHQLSPRFVVRRSLNRLLRGIR